MILQLSSRPIHLWILPVSAVPFLTRRLPLKHVMKLIQLQRFVSYPSWLFTLGW
nr:hypothetical protein Iba_chr13bCG12220 [Ipomoea batatas]GMD79061.1 hypothetical protein Iba_chr13dCG0170 [Ipomoea batatas]GMD79062.1 hypothetical protein Iba_chr13dCG0180 [Ipomoea batatas]